jgi:hypothetical protein
VPTFRIVVHPFVGATAFDALDEIDTAFVTAPFYPTDGVIVIRHVLQMPKLVSVFVPR